MNIQRPIVVFFALFIAAHVACSLPRFALQTGRSCGSCHVQSIGGQLRNSAGTSFAREDLSIEAWRTTETEEEYSGAVGKYFLFGGESRMQFLNQKSDWMQGTQDGSSLQFMQFAFYTGVTVSDRVKLFARADISHLLYDDQYNPTGIAFEATATLTLAEKALFVRAGVFQPSFGIRHDDHTLYTRGGNANYLSGGQNVGMLFKNNYVDVGAEVMYQYQNLLNIQLGIWNGGRLYPRFTESFAFNARGEISPSIGDVHLRVGGSLYSRNKKNQTTSTDSTFSMMGGFFGIGYDRFTLIGEFDVATNPTGNVKKDQKAQAFLAELGVNIIDGLEFISRYEGFDPNTEASDDQVKRMVFGLEFFPWSFIEIRPQIRLVTEKSVSGSTITEIKSTQFLTQLHVWY